MTLDESPVVDHQAHRNGELASGERPRERAVEAHGAVLEVESCLGSCTAEVQLDDCGCGPGVGGQAQGDEELHLPVGLEGAHACRGLVLLEAASGHHDAGPNGGVVGAVCFSSGLAGGDEDFAEVERAAAWTTSAVGHPVPWTGLEVSADLWLVEQTRAGEAGDICESGVVDGSQGRQLSEFAVCAEDDARAVDAGSSDDLVECVEVCGELAAAVPTARREANVEEGTGAIVEQGRPVDLDIGPLAAAVAGGCGGIDETHGMRAAVVVGQVSTTVGKDPAVSVEDVPGLAQCVGSGGGRMFEELVHAVGVGQGLDGEVADGVDIDRRKHSRHGGGAGKLASSQQQGCGMQVPSPMAPERPDAPPRRGGQIDDEEQQQVDAGVAALAYQAESVRQGGELAGRQKLSGKENAWDEVGMDLLEGGWGPCVENLGVGH